MSGGGRRPRRGGVGVERVLEVFPSYYTTISFSLHNDTCIFLLNNAHKTFFLDWNKKIPKASLCAYRF